MSRTIRKYRLELADYQEVAVGGNPVFLAAGMQDGAPVVWVECDHNDVREKWYLSAVPTGGTPTGTYLGTAHGNGSMFVWHIYRETV